MLALRSWSFAALLAAAAACGPSSSSSSPPQGPGADAPSGAVQTPAAPVDAGAGELPLPPSGKRFGATVYDGGVELRVWAPSAKSVAVTGEIGDHDLAPEGGGVFATRVASAHAGQRYRFAITTKDGSVVSRLDPHARQADGLDAVVVDPRAYVWKAPSFTPPKRRDVVVYEMHVGSFSAGGTFLSAIDGLDSLADLGVSAVELMPVNLHGSHGWGYGPRGYFAPHPDYGTPDDLRRFVDEAHARGIAVVLDVVFNHYEGWSEAPLRCFDGDCPGGSAGVYFFADDPYRMTPWGPRLDFSKPEVSDFLADDIFAWTTEFAVDGFRQDSVSNIRALDGKGSVPGGVDVLRRMNDVAAKARPGALAIAEDLKGEASVTAPAAGGGLAFDSQWDGGFQWALTSAVTSATADLGSVRDAILGSYNGDPFQRVLYVESHDTAGNDGARLPVKIDAKDPTSYAARKRSMLAAGVTLTTPGVPMIFMGEEALETTKFDPQPAPVDRTGHPEVRAFFRDLIRLRRNLDGTSAGLMGDNVVVTHQNQSPGNDVIVYRRWSSSGDDVMVIANFGSKKYTRYDIGLPAGGAWKARVDGDDVRYGADFGANGPTAVAVTAAARDGLPFTGSVALGPYALVVLSR
jgi:1,4-alpha-glucan branching enzyme